MECVNVCWLQLQLCIQSDLPSPVKVQTEFNFRLSFFPLQQIKDELCEVVSEMEALDVPEDKHSNKDKQMSIGRKKFNMDPKKGELKKSYERKKCDEKYVYTKDKRCRWYNTRHA